MEEYKSRRPHRFLRLLLLVGLVLLVIYMIRNKDFLKSRFDSWTQDDQQEVVEGNPSVVTQEEWEAMRSTVNELQNELDKLKQEVQQLKNSKPASAPKTAPATTVMASAQTAQPTTTTAPSTQQVSESFDSNAVTLVNYTHDWVQPSASVSLKNNTSQRISQVKGRMIYYDMQGNMLDYQDFTKAVDIEPGMAKSITLSGYGYYDGYAYYKSDVKRTTPDRKYKVSFELKSYK